ncbi:ER membrane protein complex subunit 3-like [Hydractinia symbiolongicarpus]|uniref:ER membrane protein complex subunit 3-like n=1 Tax=Hydractinia symbiolongicarpus TaxID=13093 RepID=UPI002550BC4D|nr:ER membrane protein complex subunit 3-like [Hydractinia symbiolongicarpus]
MDDLLLDPAIRIWVIVPIVLITFLIGVIRHHVSILLTSAKKVDVEQLKQSHVLMRSRLLRDHGKYIPLESFVMRRNFFNDEETGVLKAEKPQAPPKNPMQDPTMMMDMLKGNLTNVLPMIVIGGWINWTFSGFITTKVPFPLTLRFKAMLQRGIELTSLDASWVSSVSWYFLNVFGLRSLYSLILGQDNAADSGRVMQEQMATGGGMMGPQADPKKAFDAEWEALQIAEHNWALKNVEDELMKRHLDNLKIYAELKDKDA